MVSLKELHILVAPMATKYFMSPNHQAKNADGSWNINPPTSIFNTLYLMDNNIYKAENTRAISNNQFTYHIMDNFKV